MNYYWKCPKCKIEEQPAANLNNAKDLLEIHEKECHKKKPIGMFGWSKKHP